MIYQYLDVYVVTRITGKILMKKQFANVYKFCDHDIDKFIMMK